MLTGLPQWLSGKESSCNAGDAGDAGDSGSIPGLGRSPGGGHGNPLQYSCLRNLMVRGAWQATVHGVTPDLDMTEHTVILSNMDSPEHKMSRKEARENLNTASPFAESQNNRQNQTMVLLVRMLINFGEAQA